MHKKLEELRKTMTAEPSGSARFELYARETLAMMDEYSAKDDLKGVKALTGELRRQAPIFGRLIAGGEQGKGNAA